MIAAELEATWCWNVQTCFLVSGFVEERNLYSTYGIHDFFKGAKVNVDVVINVDSKVLINGVSKRVGVLAFECSVNSVRSC